MKKSNIFILIIIILIIIVLIVGFIPKLDEEKSEEVKIGVLVSLTGSAAPYGNWAKNGLELVANEIEKETGQKINLIIEDDNSDPKKAVSAAQKLINIDGVKVIIAGTSSSSFLAVAPITEENRVILFGPMSSSPKISEAGDYIFRNRVSGLAEASKAADFIINDLGRDKKIAVIFENSDFGIDYNNVFEKRILDLGNNVLIKEKYTQGATDFRTNLAKIKDYNPDVVYALCYINDCVNIFKQAKELDFDPIWVSTSGVENQKLLNSTPIDMLSKIYYVSEYYDLNDPTIKSFNEKYQAIYGEKANLYASNSYDAMKIIYYAIKEEGYDVNKIKDYLYNLKNYKGVNGLLTFDENGDVIKPLMIKTIKNGEFIKYGKE